MTHLSLHTFLGAKPALCVHFCAGKQTKAAKYSAGTGLSPYSDLDLLIFRSQSQRTRRYDDMTSEEPVRALRDIFGDPKPPEITRKITACVACRKQKVGRVFAPAPEMKKALTHGVDQMPDGRF
jgi:hypothetical protein